VDAIVNVAESEGDTVIVPTIDGWEVVFIVDTEEIIGSASHLEMAMTAVEKESSGLEFNTTFVGSSRLPIRR
jgi:hypothetical protein